MLMKDRVKKEEGKRPSLESLFRPIERDIERLEEVLLGFFRSPYPFIQAVAGPMEQSQGKRLRPAILLLAAQAFGGEAPRAVETAAIVELIHMATLCHDDVLDEASVRRGLATPNALFGNKAAVITGDMLLAFAFEELSKHEDPRSFQILSGTARAICEGELLQLGSRFNIRLSEQDYLTICEKKTASLFGSAAKLGALLAGASEEEGERMGKFGRLFGLAFQVVDDCLDWVGKESVAGKTLGCDFRNGDPTLPLLHAFAQSPPAEKMKFLDFFRPEGPTAMEGLGPFLQETGSIAYCLQLAKAKAICAQCELNRLSPSAARHSLQGLLEFILAVPEA